MSPYISKQSSEYVSGSWNRSTIAKGIKSATFVCPTCKGTMSLSHHLITKIGAVTPSVMCPYDCTFHKWVVLAGWYEPIIPTGSV